MIREVHAASYGNYGAKRVHAELILGRGIQVGHNAVAMLMHRAGIAGRSGARRRWGIPSVATADDLVDRMFLRERPNQLWVTDITEHPTRGGKVYHTRARETTPGRGHGVELRGAGLRSSLNVVMGPRRPRPRHLRSCDPVRR